MKRTTLPVALLLWSLAGINQTAADQTVIGQITSGQTASGQFSSGQLTRDHLEGNQLTAEQTLRMVISRPAIQQRIHAETGLGEGILAEAEKWSNPQFFINRETLKQGNSVEQSYGLSQEFDFSGRRGLNIEAAQQHLNSAKMRARAVRRAIESDTLHRFYQALYQQQRQSAYQKTEARLEKVNHILSRRRSEGDVSRYDYQRVRAEHARMQAQGSVSRANAYQAWQQLLALLGDKASHYKGVQGKLLPGQVAELKQLLPALEQQPELLALKREAKALRLRQRAAAKLLPPITLSAGVRQVEENGLSDDGVMFSASLPIPLFDSGQDQQLTYQAKASIAQSEYQLARDRAAGNLKSTWQRCQSLRQSAVTYRVTADRQSKDLIKLAEAWYQAGQVGILELLDAYRSTLEAELVALELEYETRLARIELDSLSMGAQP